MDGPGQDVVSLMKDCMARCEFSGRIASPRKSGLSGLGQDMFSFIKDCIATWVVSGRMATSRKYGSGLSGPGYG